MSDKETPKPDEQEPKLELFFQGDKNKKLVVTNKVQEEAARKEGFSELKSSDESEVRLDEKPSDARPIAERNVSPDVKQSSKSERKSQ